MYPTMRASTETMEGGRTPFGSVAEEVARLSEQDLALADYYREVLRRLLPALGAPAGAVWSVDWGRRNSSATLTSPASAWTRSAASPES